MVYYKPLLFFFYLKLHIYSYKWINTWKFANFPYFVKWLTEIVKTVKIVSFFTEKVRLMSTDVKKKWLWCQPILGIFYFFKNLNYLKTFRFTHFTHSWHTFSYPKNTLTSNVMAKFRRYERFQKIADVKLFRFDVKKTGFDVNFFGTFWHFLQDPPLTNG